MWSSLTTVLLYQQARININKNAHSRHDNDNNDDNGTAKQQAPRKQQQQAKLTGGPVFSLAWKIRAHSSIGL